MARSKAWAGGGSLPLTDALHASAPVVTARRVVPIIDRLGYIHEVVRMSVCTPCQPIEHQIQDLRNQIDAILNSPGYIQGPDDPHPGRPDPDMLREVKDLWKQVGDLDKQLSTCIITNCAGKPDLLVTPSGTFSIDTAEHGNTDSLTSRYHCKMLFHKFDHSHFDIFAFNLDRPTLTIPFTYSVANRPVLNLTDVVTVTPSPGSGTFDSATGAMTAGMDVTVTHMVSPIVTPLGSYTYTVDPSRAHFDLSTSPPPGAPPGMPMNLTTGDFTLAGMSRFVSSYLDGAPTNLVISGTITPIP